MTEYDDICNDVALEVSKLYEKQISEMKRLLSDMIDDYNAACQCVRCIGKREKIYKILELENEENVV